MKQEWKLWLRLGITLFLLYLAIHYWGTISHLLLLALGAAFPLILGCIIAYAVNILMSIYERFCFPNSRGSIARLRRPLCLVLAYASLVALVFLIIRMILPELVQSVGLLVQEAAPMIERLAKLLNQNLDLSQLLTSYGVALYDGNINWQEALTAAVKWLSQGLGGVMGSMISLFSSLFSTLFTLIISFIFSIYLLLGKERLSRQSALVLKTYLKPNWYRRVIYFLETLNTCFHRFIVGQCTEAVILGLLCIGGMLLFRFPYATMVGTLIGFTALIPVAGAYIGAGVGAFMIFTVSPIQALLFLLFICVLQQVEGNLIYPKVVGSSIGLPGIWVLTAVTVGGGMMGIFGMLLAVPLAATFYQVLRGDIYRRMPPQEDSPPPCDDTQE
ncbi:AI-2E family transporter [Flavonifractor sp. An100]|uniref:AI-2E family transporter n=1 Tax=Flavonifractor sp. An100 TaxID=1965538 RepID=UPI000B3A310A|nr:AI-2E family transporter [Flavonifractor sp. An100]OUQ80248.1 AI-2E family transporter [Flavonifractor sp. An100]